ncbi:Anaphase-promoting complex subunit 11 [Melipona quadrifasciata]|uniref:Anaphase-promoting complex subunit 11 n=2 Tax=Meliponini TaxID=83319 RepID=A0A0N0BEN8_9HYME|nr:Anaphase-promoting complex subunit 11 [Melipona quadrifasciata]
MVATSIALEHTTACPFTYNHEREATPGSTGWPRLSSFPFPKDIAGWTGVATWRWIANDDNCGICRMPFDASCPDCKIPGDDCPLVWGQCSHCFHIHCIMKWLHSQQTRHLCPMCRQEWKFKE